MESTILGINETFDESDNNKTFWTVTLRFDKKPNLNYSQKCIIHQLEQTEKVKE